MHIRVPQCRLHPVVRRRVARSSPQRFASGRMIHGATPTDRRVTTDRGRSLPGHASRANRRRGARSSRWPSPAAAAAPTTTRPTSPAPRRPPAPRAPRRRRPRISASRRSPPRTRRGRRRRRDRRRRGGGAGGLHGRVADQPPAGRRARRRRRLARRARRVGPDERAAHARRCSSRTAPTSSRPRPRTRWTALAPTGSKEAGGAQVIRVGDVPELDGTRPPTCAATAPSRSPARSTPSRPPRAGTTSDRVLVVGADAPAVRDARRGLGGQGRRPDPVHPPRQRPAEDTRAAIAAHQQPKIYVLGPTERRLRQALAQLKKLGSVDAHRGRDPVASSIAFARFVDGAFGWGVVDPGHGFVFANTSRPGDAARRGAAVGQRYLRPAAGLRRRDQAADRAAGATCSTYSPATAGIRCAGSTITAGSSATRTRSRSPSNRRSTLSWRSSPSTNAEAPHRHHEPGREPRSPQPRRHRR